MRALGHDGGWGGRFGKWALERWGLLNIQYVFCFAWKGIDKRNEQYVWDTESTIMVELKVI